MYRVCATHGCVALMVALRCSIPLEISQRGGGALQSDGSPQPQLDLRQVAAQTLRPAREVLRSTQEAVAQISSRSRGA